jgi:class 3 adenylate cyclase
VDELTSVVRGSEQFQKAEAADKLVKIPAGDGMALVFYTSPEGPVQCATEISRALKNHPKLQLRMGVHSCPISGLIDVMERANLAGAGINVAQRVRIAAMLVISCFHNVLPKISLNTIRGGHCCMTLAHVK